MSGVWVCMMGGTLVGIAAVSMMLAMRRVMAMMEGTTIMEMLYDRDKCDWG